LTQTFVSVVQCQKIICGNELLRQTRDFATVKTGGSFLEIYQRNKMI